MLYTLPLFVRWHKLLERGIKLSFVCWRRLWGIHTFACRHRLLERSIHTFLCTSAQAGSGVYILSLVGTGFQNEAYTLYFVCRRRLWGIHTFACRHKLSERSIHTFLCMSAQALGYTYFRLSAQAFRTGHTHFLFPCVLMSAQAPSYTHFRLTARVLIE